MKRELIFIISNLSFWGTKFLSKRNFVQSKELVSFTGFDDTYHSFDVDGYWNQLKNIKVLLNWNIFISSELIWKRPS